MGDTPTKPEVPLLDVALLPMKLDAFVFNEEVCSGSDGEAKIAPITQPNYTFLRLDRFSIQPDILDHVDLHYSSPAAHNSRCTDLGQRETRRRRLGVYLHWMVPRPYRYGSTAKANHEQEAPEPTTPDPHSPGDSEKEKPKMDSTTPSYRPVPNRWLVIRSIEDLDAVQPQLPIPKVEAWVVESDRKFKLDNLDENVDLQVDVSPFIDASAGAGVSIDDQAEVFIGSKTNANTWKESDQDRVPLSLLNSSNQLFADYQPHNSNVFSICDNFEYNGQYLEKATASYYVIGWHDKPESDLLYQDIASKNVMSRSALFNDWNLSMMPSSLVPQLSEWLDAKATTRLLCHGAMYQVKWDLNNLPKNVPSNDCCKVLMNKLPISIGMTPMDALLAYVHAHKDFDPNPLNDLESSLDRVQKLLQARDDGVESQREASDLLMTWNYDHSEGGKRFHLNGGDAPADSKPTEPSDDQKQALKELNEKQILLDATNRILKQLRWDLFSLWWTYLSDPQGPAKAGAIKATIQNSLGPRINDLKSKANLLIQDIKNRQKEVNCIEPGVMEAFSRQRDPTLLVGSVKSGWPTDYLDKLAIRTNAHVLNSEIQTKSENWKIWKPIVDVITKVLPTESLQLAGNRLFEEFVLLDPSSIPPTDQKGEAPLYHDMKDEEAKWRDQWGDTQPFFPLFLEWEGRYTHIPFEKWSLEERAVDPKIPKKLRYGIDPDEDLAKMDDTDHRLLSGRVLMLPQPNFSLKAKIDQLFDQTPETVLERYLDRDKWPGLQKNLGKLAFMSAPMSGLIDHLTTRTVGSHIKPTVRRPGQANVPIDEASSVTNLAGFSAEIMELIGDQTALTPYGTLAHPTEENMLFKPVTHGQFRFTKLNIIDKFGQAVHAIDPILKKTPPKPVYPCLSEFYQPQALSENDGHKICNTVVAEPEDLCSHIQLSPQINQLARINASFVQYDDHDANTEEKAPWRPVDEWENPIWGWVLVNYANLGLQFFLFDGTFYREVRFGGPKGTQTSQPWLPFRPPEEGLGAKGEADPEKATKMRQLDLLIEKMSDREYLQEFVDMITDAMQNSPAAPTAYAEFLNAVISRPLALVNMGFSLELAIDALQSQSTLEPNPTVPPPVLLQDRTKGAPYEFPVKIGDGERLFDGLVAYFLPEDIPTASSQLKLEEFYTFSKADFATKPGSPASNPEQNSVTTEENKTKHRINSHDYPKLKAFWVSPDTIHASKDESKTAAWDRNYVQSHTRQRNSKLSAFGALIDPFLSVHLFSSILPITSLALPPWTWQQAMQKMTAFFHIGPVLVTKDVPDYIPQKELSSENYNLGDPNLLVNTAPVGIPALQSGDWAWLQPYIDSERAKKMPKDPLDGRAFMALTMEPVDEKPRFEDGPYTALEGYLQLRKPIVRPMENGKKG